MAAATAGRPLHVQPQVAYVYDGGADRCFVAAGRAESPRQQSKYTPQSPPQLDSQGRL